MCNKSKKRSRDNLDDEFRDLVGRAIQEGVVRTEAETDEVIDPHVNHEDGGKPN